MTLSRLAALSLKFAPVPLLAALLLASSANAQSPSQSQSQPPSQTSSQSSRQQSASSAWPSQSSADPQMQTVEGDKPVSLAEAARKAKAQKSKTDSGKVMTEDDLRSIRGGGVSVVGDASSSRSTSAPAYTPGAPSARDQEEQIWRSRARAIMDQMEQVDRAIETTKAEIAKYGGVGFDPSSGLKQNIVVIEDRNAQLKSLENQRARLDQQMDALQEEGRKAGADPSWFR
jgi:chromosome segregation ATPase